MWETRVQGQYVKSAVIRRYVNGCVSITNALLFCWVVLIVVGKLLCLVSSFISGSTNLALALHLLRLCNRLLGTLNPLHMTGSQISLLQCDLNCIRRGHASN